MKGCPASSYSREPVTGAVVIDDKKCVGCRYCQWNCPYDAPKYESSQKVIGKCNLCHQRLINGLMPACSTACPTGALEYGKLNEKPDTEIFTWFPGKNLDPALEMKGKKNPPLIIIPQKPYETEIERSKDNDLSIKGEWSLVAFSFLTTLSVAKIISSLIEGIFPDKIKFIPVIMIAGLVSMFHLGKKRRGWRVVSNLKYSPLSREIALFILYFLSSIMTVILQLPVLLIISSIIGLILVMSIDAVYLFADKRKYLLLHSGQTFITVLLVVSFLTGNVFPFIFIAAIKLGLSVRRLEISGDGSIKFVLRFFRWALLIIAGISMISGISYPGTESLFLFLTGELIDRILFYADFKPLNIKRSINNHLM